MKFKATIRKEGVPDEVRIVEAPSRFDVYSQVRNEGGFVALIEEQHSLSFEALKRFNISIGTGVKRIEIIQTAKNLSAMLSAGLSISRALSVIERQSSNKNLKAIATGLSESVRKGASFHEALTGYPRVFPEIFVAMVRAGEESGSLAESLQVVALQMERSEELARKIKGAMIYPSIVVTAVIIVGVLMLIYVVPTLTNTFTSLGVKVPLATQIIVALSDFMVANVALVFIALIAIFVGIFVFVRSRIGSKIVLGGALHMPVIGELVRETYAARLA